jgi:hypothetical protein
MSLSPGSHLGPYEILGPIGAGGMGAVYRARDPRLARDVAIKVLPASLSTDSDRLLRFEQEARAAAALNHPNILTVHEIGTHDGEPFVVSELLEGQTLREAMTGGELPVKKAIDYAVQICHGLAAAHEKGIVHRDLKPENLFVMKDGRVKILDFGLAKLTEGAGAGVGATGFATRAVDTTPGSVMGTVGYMSPEQVRGQSVDQRSDIFSLGAVLYEMLSGERAFKGDSPADTMSAILKENPADLSTTSRLVIPPSLDRLVCHCLEKGPERRFYSAHDVAFALEGVAERGSLTVGARPTAWGVTAHPWAWTTAALSVALLVTLSLLVRPSRGPAADTTAVRFIIPLEQVSFNTASTTGLVLFSVSPNGKWLVFVGASEGRRQLWIKAFDALTARPLAGTEEANSTPFWSPDSQFIAYATPTQLKRADLRGTPAHVLCELPRAVLAGSVGGTWNAEGVIVFSVGDGSGLFRVPSTGGTPLALTRVDGARGETGHLWPQFLPDGTHLLVVIRSKVPAQVGLYVTSLTGTSTALLVPGVERNGVYVAGGYLLFSRDQVLLAQRLDLGRLSVLGEAKPVVSGVQSVAVYNRSAFSVSDTGVLAFQNLLNANGRFVWLDSSGTSLGASSERGPFFTFDLTQTGTRTAAARIDPLTGDSNIWVIDRARGTTSPLTFGPFYEADPVWSPDGREIAFTSTRNGGRNIFKIAATGGTPSEILNSEGRPFGLDAWSPDGRFLLFHVTGDRALYALPLSGERKPFVCAQGASGQAPDEASFSPDGKWITFNSDESGTWQVYATRFPPTNEKWQISTNGGVQARWRSDGKELYYLAPDGTLVAVTVDLKDPAAPHVGPPRSLFRTRLTPSATVDQYRVTADGHRFLVLDSVDSTVSPLTVVLNWTTALKE